MNAPTVVTSSVTTTSIPLSWTAPTGVKAGGTGITVDTYDLEFSTDGTTYSTLATAVSGTTYTHTVTAGTSTYYYKIRATNEYGTQLVFSASSTGVVATSVPSQPAAPTVTQTGTMVSIEWTLPASNYATITSYKVSIRASSNSYIERTAVCDGSLDTVIASRKCLVPMSSLLASPYTLSRGEGI